MRELGPVEQVGMTWPPGNPVACPRQGAHH
jgi:hypothetical protein